MKKKNFTTGKSSGLPDYHEYRMNGQEYLVGILGGMACAVLLAYIFYRSLFAVIFLCPVIPFCVKV